MLFSSSLKPNRKELPNLLLSIIKEIGEYFNISEPNIYEFDDNSIAISATVKVELPHFGTVGGIDIRENEPILIKLKLKRFEYYIPVVLSDRIDFPKQHLSHLYATRKNEPAKLCLVRGNPNEWYGGKRIQDLLAVTQEWFNKAASGKLSTDGDEFDPIRLDNFEGYHVYKYELVRDVVNAGVTFIPDLPVGALFSFIYLEDDRITYKTLKPIQFIELTDSLALIQAAKNAATEENYKNPLLSFVVWSPNLPTDSTYQLDFPTNYKELKEYFHSYSIDIEKILKSLDACGSIIKKFVPILHAIKRPNKVIGFPGEFEFVNFVVEVNSKKGKIDELGKVTYQSHIEPFSSDLAFKLTNEIRDKRTLYLGAGSLGSKIILHDARTGKLSIGICDEDDFLHHNQVRHALFSDKLFQKKATAIVEILNSMFEVDLKRDFKAFPFSVSFLTDEQIGDYEWLVDSTASLNVQNWLVQRRFPESIKIARCEIVYDGRLGLLYIEGNGRNPRIDDLVNLAYYKATTISKFRDWRLSDSIKDVTTLDIGLGCSSATVILPDDLISVHAGSFSTVISRQEIKQNLDKNGLMYYTAIGNNEIPAVSSNYEIIKPFDTFLCRAGSGWEIRMIAGLKEKLFKECQRYRPRETGGVLIGICNYKTKTIHVFDIIKQTKDSSGTTTAFTRGIVGLPVEVESYKLKTGNMIGYIGEWHTHPMDLKTLSSRDMETIEELKKINSQIPIPTLAIIVTNNELIPFVFT